MTVTPKRSQLLPIPAFSLLSHQRKQTSVSYLALRTSALLKQKQQAGFNGFEPFFQPVSGCCGGLHFSLNRSGADRIRKLALESSHHYGLLLGLFHLVNEFDLLVKR